MEFKPGTPPAGLNLLPMRLFTRPLEVPRRLRAIVYARESSVIALAVIIGIIAGLVAAAMGEVVGLMHQLFFGRQRRELLGET